MRCISYSKIIKYFDLVIIIMGIVNTSEFSKEFTPKEIQKLYARFLEIDLDSSGDLDPK